MGILTRFFGKRVRSQIENYRSRVSETLAVFLCERYANEHHDWDIEKAAALATAVTNELLGLPPGNANGRAFLQANGPLVEVALRRIKEEPQICRTVSIFLHMLGNVAGNDGTLSAEMLESGFRLRQLGILLPLEQIRLPTSPEGLAQQAGEFEQCLRRVQMQAKPEPSNERSAGRGATGLLRHAGHSPPDVPDCGR